MAKEEKKKRSFIEKLGGFRKKAKSVLGKTREFVGAKAEEAKPIIKKTYERAKPIVKRAITKTGEIAKSIYPAYKESGLYKKLEPRQTFQAPSYSTYSIIQVLESQISNIDRQISELSKEPTIEVANLEKDQRTKSLADLGEVIGMSTSSKASGF